MSVSTKYHILLFGGTGICGRIFTQAALEAGHTLTLYVRNPSKIPTEFAANPDLHTIQGELGDEEGLKKAAACGAEIFVSLAGPTLGKREGTPITNALHIFYPYLLSSGTFKRIFLLSTPSFSVPEDSNSIKWWVSINMYIRVIGGDSYAELTGMSKETVALGEKIGWTVFRVPLLQGKELNGNPGKVEACYIGDKKGRDGIHLDRGRLIKWILAELEEGKWICACPALANA